MQGTNLIPALLAVLTGAAITTQVTLSSQAAATLGPVRTGMWLHIMGAGVSVALLAGVVLLSGRAEASTLLPQGPVLLYVLAGGVLGIGIVAGAAYAVPRIGVTAGQVTIIFGQIALAIVIDLLGTGVLDAISLNPRRIVGLVVLGVAIWLLLPPQ